MKTETLKFKQYKNALDTEYTNVDKLTVTSETEIIYFTYNDFTGGVTQDLILKNGKEIMRFKRQLK